MNVRHPAPPATILVVDDDPFIRSTTEIHLRARGFTTLLAGNGQEGLALFLRHRPDLLIVDLKMPVMDGLELLSKLAGTSALTPVIVISGEGGLDEALEALRRGAWDYLVKPITSMSVLDHAVSKALERAALIRENENYKINLELQVLERTLELEKANEELEKANEELEHQFIKQQKLGIIGTLAGGMAHDFNNILSSIVFSTELIRGAIASNEPPDQEDMERILRVCQRGTALIRSVLHFTGKMHEEFHLFPISETLHETMGIIESTTPSRTEITTRIDHGLGVLLGDPVHLQQILMNLITNAIHATSDTPNPHVDVCARICPHPDKELLLAPPNARIALITVTDNGAGISPENLNKLCEPFFTTKTPDKGTGLGLFITKKIVKTLKGTLRFSSAPGKGTSVRVYLPALLPQAEEMAEPECQPTIWGNAERILVVASHPEVRATICTFLEKIGYHPFSADSHDQGSEMARNEPGGFDIVMVDPEAPGQFTALCARVRQANPSAKIILVTDPSAVTLQGTHRAGPMPIDISRLGQTLKTCLAGSARRHNIVRTSKHTH